MRVYSSLLIIKEIMETIVLCEKSYLDEHIETHGPVKSSYHPLAPHQADVWLPCHYFDYIGGTGSGGLIAIMLGRLRMDVHDSILAFESLLREVFSHTRWFHYRSLLFWPRPKFDHQVLERAIRDLALYHAPGVPSFSEDSNFAYNENQCRTIVLAFRRGFTRKRPYVFRTYNKFPTRHTSGRNLGLAHHIPIWQVARATTASPTLFRPVIIDDHEYVSCSLRTKNPCEEIYNEVQNMNGTDNVNTILSIGTGIPRIRLGPLGFLDIYSLFALQRIPRKITSTRDYYRLDVEILGQLEMDEWRAGSRIRTKNGSETGRHRSEETAAIPGPQSQTTLTTSENSSVPNIKNAKISIPERFRPRIDTAESIRKHIRDYLDRADVQSKINEIATSLVRKRRNRVKSDLERWEEFCYETWYQCKVYGCRDYRGRYSSRRALRIHILDKHSDRYSMRDQVALEAALDEGRIRVG